MTHIPRVMIVDSSAERAAALCNVLIEAGLAAVHVDAYAKANTEGCDLLVVDYDELSDTERAELPLRFGEGATGKTRLLLHAVKLSRAEFISLCGARVLTNLIAKRNGAVPVDDFLVTVRKILDGQVFGIERYFPAGAVVQTHLTRDSSDKDKLLSVVEEFVAAANVNARFSTLLQNVADELLTNALYNAPVDAGGTHRHASQNRRVSVSLPEHEVVTLRLCSDGGRIGISVHDPFGSLSPQRLWDYLAKCMRRGEDQVDDKEGGAGLGLYYVFESLSHLVVNLAPGKATEVIGIVDAQASFREFAGRGKSFNIFLRN